MSNTKSFVAKEFLKPILSELIQSKVFDAGYEVCKGVRILFDKDDSFPPGTLLIDMFADSNVCIRGTFEIYEDGEEIFNKIKSAIIEFASNKQTFTALLEDGTRSLIECGIDASVLLKEANDIILTTPYPIHLGNPEIEDLKEFLDPYHEDHFEISYFDNETPSGNSFFIQK